MINPISQSNNIKTSIFLINDFHGKSLNMERAVTASQEFDAKYKNRKDVDTFKLSSGDIMIGEDFKTNELAIMFQRMLGITASALGNHEYDMQHNIGMILPQVKYNLLACNIKIHERNPLSKVVQSSIIEERNGHKYGIIGTSPIDLFKRSKNGVIQQDITISKTNETINDVQK